MYPFGFRLTMSRAASAETQVPFARRAEDLEMNVVIGDAGLVGSGRPARESLVGATKSVPTGLEGTDHVLYGTFGQLRERLRRRRDRLRISSDAIPGHALEALAPLVAALSGR